MATLRRSIAASVLFTLFGGPGILLVLVPWLLTRFRLPAHLPPARTAFAAVSIAAGLVPLLESTIRFVATGRGSLVPLVPTEHLVVTGFYRFVRNPMYIGVFFTLAGEALLFWDRGLEVELLVISICMHLFVRFYEEQKLSRMFGEDYLLFCRNVPRWIPRLTPWRPKPA